MPPTPLLGGWAEGGWSISNPVTSQILARNLVPFDSAGSKLSDPWTLQPLQPCQLIVLNPLKNRWQGHVAVRVVALEACGRVWGVWGRANGSLEPPEKQMAGAWQGHVAVRVVALEACGRVWRVWRRANGSLEPPKNRWQGHVAVRVVALEACGRVWSVWGRANGSLEPPEKSLRKGLGGLRPGKRQSWTPWKTDGRGM